ncbi:hypothetical protein GWE18_34925 [Bradyrhizobium sp. CSA112]|nr:hypothetical protein [Bradyrhizobium sp. CSA112]
MRAKISSARNPRGCARPFGSHVTVTSRSTGRTVTVRINDRGPFVRGRCIDLSNGAARAFGMGDRDGVSKLSENEHRLSPTVRVDFADDRQPR